MKLSYPESSIIKTVEKTKRAPREPVLPGLYLFEMKTLPTSPTAKSNKIKTLPDTQNPESEPKPNRMKTLRTFRPGEGHPFALELVEHKERPGHQTAEGSKVVPMQLV